MVSMLYPQYCIAWGTCMPWHCIGCCAGWLLFKLGCCRSTCSLAFKCGHLGGLCYKVQSGAPVHDRWGVHTPPSLALHQWPAVCIDTSSKLLTYLPCSWSLPAWGASSCDADIDSWSLLPRSCVELVCGVGHARNWVYGLNAPQDCSGLLVERVTLIAGRGICLCIKLMLGSQHLHYCICRSV